MPDDPATIPDDPATSPPPKGASICAFGRYRILRRLGTGGFGSVFLAFDPKHGREVAIKVINLTASDQDPLDSRKRFLREIKVTAAVHSPHVVRIYGAGITEERPYLSMEYVPGSTLGQVLLLHGRQPVAEAVRIGRSVARGLAAIHDHGLVHRDIKPDNVLLGDDGAVKIIDFGLARMLERDGVKVPTQLTMSNMALGSPAYISPDAVQDSHAAGPASDVYSFGAMLFHVVAGRPVFTHKGAMKQVMAHLREAPPSLAEVLAGADPRLVHLVDGCLEKKPAKRPTAAELADALEILEA